jgi:hypothetical protein
MSVQLALQRGYDRLAVRLRLPAGVPPLKGRVATVIAICWFALFALAIVAPIGGLYDRFVHSGENSQLMLGSRAGIVVAEKDATRIRFTVGPTTKALGIKPGDDIVAVNGLAVADVVTMEQKAIEAGRGPSEADLAVFADLLYGTDNYDAVLRIRSRDGAERDVTVRLGEEHIEAGARSLGIPPFLLAVVDLLHVLAYPFLLAVAWVLHRRKPEDAVSTLVSFAVLLNIAAERPAANFLIAMLGVPLRVQSLLFDLGNIALVAGIVLFPHGRFSPRLVVPLLLTLPVLFFLSGDIYRTVLMFLMFGALVVLIRRLRQTPPSDIRQQIKWALFGFFGYAIFFGASLILDIMKRDAESFAGQLLLETTAGLTVGIAFLCLLLGLMVALLRYRLYDAEVVISRSASFAVITLIVGAAFAGVVEGIITSVQEAFGGNAGAGAAVLGGIVATVLINPLHGRIQGWAERWFNRDLMELRRDLPECVRDIREVASLPEMLHEVLQRIRAGVRTVRVAVVVDGVVQDVSGVTREEAEQWLSSYHPPEHGPKVECDAGDQLFPVRVSLSYSTDQLCIGWLLVGRRPDGTTLGRDEREALAGIADPVARAIRIVLKRDRQDQEIAELIDSHRRRIEGLEARLAAAAPAGPRSVAR